MPQEAVNFDTMSDAELVRRAIQRDGLAIRTITLRHNQRLFRAAWGILRHHADAEDVVQEVYLKAFTALESYSGQASLSTWLTRIVINTAIDRQRAALRRQTSTLDQDIAMLDDYREKYVHDAEKTPESDLLRAEISQRLKAAIAKLAEEFRLVFILRDIEGMSARETAEALGVKEATVKTRLFRARRDLRADLAPDLKSIFTETLPFAGADCEAMTDRVLKALNIHP